MTSWMRNQIGTNLYAGDAQELEAMSDLEFESDDEDEDEEMDDGDDDGHRGKKRKA